jgi:class 3 adenylate cyclase/tetratricopeptide (TPR) repeat protein
MTCPNCAADNAESSRFCSQCGTALEAPRLVEGERKQVTVLFADVVDSTAMAESLDPEHYAEVMDGAFAFMSAGVVRYGGTVARLMGDAVLAFFGAPVAHEDDAERAVRAALMIRADALEYARSVEPRHGIRFRIRVGVNTGLVVAGEIGPEGRTEYTAMGDATNVAARLQALARPGTILVSASAQRLTQARFEFTPLGSLPLKGKSAPIDAYEVGEPTDVASPDWGMQGIRSPLVGRKEELGRLVSRVSALRDGRGSLITVVGEAGIGKSRLLAEARAHEAEGAARWLEGRAFSYEQSTAYAPWRQILRELIGAREGEAPEVLRERLGGEWALRGAPRGDLPFIEGLLGVESEESRAALASLEGDAVVGRITESVCAYLRSLAAEAPVALVFDDLHWADTASLELILGMAGLTRSSPVLILCSLRPERASPGWTFLEAARRRLGEQYIEIMVDPLSAEHSKRLLATLLDVHGLPDDVRDLVLQKSEGNPFFLEEVLRSLVDSGLIVREGSRWRATTEIAGVAVPDTLVGVLSARIDRLPDDTKRVAQTAAVIGRIFPRRLLTTVCVAAPPPERVANLVPHLGALTQEEVIRERSRQPELEYIFKHALTQQAAYDLLLVKRRRAIHRRTAEALEALHPERGDEIAALLAYHYRRAEVWEPATTYSRRAGERAVRLFALKEAYDHYGHAVDGAMRLEAADPRRLIDVVLEWTFVSYALRLHEREADRKTVDQRLRRAEGIARHLDDRPRLARVLVWQGNLDMLAGYPSESFQKLREGYEIAVDTGDEELALLPLFAMTWFMVDQDPGVAVARLGKVIADARRYARQPGARELEAHALAVLGLAHARIGEFGEAETAIEQALELAPHTRSPIKEADIDLAVAMVYYEMGDMERGLRYSRTGTEHALSVNGMECACTGTFLLGFGHLQMRRIDEALAALEASFALAAPLGKGMQSERIRIQASLAFARFSAGDEHALAEMETALANARALADEYASAFISQMLGEARALTGGFQQAEERYEAALAFYRKKGMTPSMARVLTAMADLYDWQSRSEDAEQARAEAEALWSRLAAWRSPPQPTVPVVARRSPSGAEALPA